MTPERYFDYAATGPIDPRVREAMHPWVESFWGNAHSPHAWGQRARAAVEAARERIAAAIGAEDPAQIFFTSGATEANHWAMAQVRSVAASPFEHSSIRLSGIPKTVLKNDGYDLLSGEAELVAVMAVCNETGAILQFPPGQARRLADLTQAVGKIPFSLDGLDFATFSAHKFGGPMGIGALFARDPHMLMPHHAGGEQEQGKRGGTLNVPGVVGMAAALEFAVEEQPERSERAGTHREVVLESLKGLSDWQTDLPSHPHSPFILSLSFAGLEGETLVVELDTAGFAISSGAACSTLSTEPNPVLMALGTPEELLRGSIRISYGPHNITESCEELAKVLQLVVRRLRNSRL